MPALTGQPTGNSTGPQVDVSHRLGGDGSTVGDVGELQHTARLEHAVDLVEHGALVGAQVDDAVGDHDVGPAILDRQLLGETATELDVRQTEHFARGSGLGEHLVGHVDTDDVAVGADVVGGDEAVEASAGADIDDAFPGAQLAQRERVADPGERLDRAIG